MPLTEKRYMLSEGCSAGLCQWSGGVRFGTSEKNVYKIQAVYLYHGYGPVEFDRALKGRIIPSLNYVSCKCVIFIERLHEQMI